jgi:hypothetical protein
MLARRLLLIAVLFSFLNHARAQNQGISAQEDLENRIHHMMKIQDEIAENPEAAHGSLSALGQLIEMATRAENEALNAGSPDALAEAQQKVIGLENEAVKIENLKNQADFEE